jgi:hypothetical protein
MILGHCILIHQYDFGSLWVSVNDTILRLQNILILVSPIILMLLLMYFENHVINTIKPWRWSDQEYQYARNRLSLFRIFIVYIFSALSIPCILIIVISSINYYTDHNFLLLIHDLFVNVGILLIGMTIVTSTFCLMEDYVTRYRLRGQNNLPIADGVAGICFIPQDLSMRGG